MHQQYLPDNEEQRDNTGNDENEPYYALLYQLPAMVYQVVKKSLISRFSEESKETINRLLSKAYLFIKASEVFSHSFLDTSLIPDAAYQRDGMLIPYCSHDRDYRQYNRRQKQD